LAKKAFLQVNYAFKTSSLFNESQINCYFLGFTKYPALEHNLLTSEEQADIGNSLQTIIGRIRRRFDRVAKAVNGSFIVGCDRINSKRTIISKSTSVGHMAVFALPVLAPPKLPAS